MAGWGNSDRRLGSVSGGGGVTMTEYWVVCHGGVTRTEDGGIAVTEDYVVAGIWWCRRQLTEDSLTEDWCSLAVTEIDWCS